MIVIPNPAWALEDQTEDVLRRMVMWAEARGESVLGRLAVAWVVQNRAVARDSTAKREILRPWQFSSFNAKEHTGQREAMMDAHRRDPRGWAAVDAIAELFEHQSTIDPTHSATHYYVLEMPNPPAWGRGDPGWEETVILGRHVFGKQS